LVCRILSWPAALAILFFSFFVDIDQFKRVNDFSGTLRATPFSSAAPKSSRARSGTQTLLRGLAATNLILAQEKSENSSEAIFRRLESALQLLNEKWIPLTSFLSALAVAAV